MYREEQQIFKIINHLIYRNDIKVFAKNGKELETQTIRIYSQDIEYGWLAGCFGLMPNPFLYK